MFAILKSTASAPIRSKPIAHGKELDERRTKSFGDSVLSANVAGRLMGVAY